MYLYRQCLNLDLKESTHVLTDKSFSLENRNKTCIVVLLWNSRVSFFPFKWSLVLWNAARSKVYSYSETRSKKYSLLINRKVSAQERQWNFVYIYSSESALSNWHRATVENNLRKATFCAEFIVICRKVW